MAIAWSRISSKVIAYPPQLWRLGRGSAMSLSVGPRGNARRKYTRNREAWPAKVSRAVEPLTGGRSGSRWHVSATGTWPVALGRLHARPPEHGPCPPRREPPAAVDPRPRLPMLPAGLRQPRGADEPSEHGYDHQSSPPHRMRLLSGLNLAKPKN